jgi:hypothetical protein
MSKEIIFKSACIESGVKNTFGIIVYCKEYKSSVLFRLRLALPAMRCGRK